MRRFIKTITARRHINFFVIQDGDQRRYEVLRWAAEEPVPELVASFEYAAQVSGDEDLARTGRDEARGLAIAEAKRLADWEEQLARDAARQEQEAAAAERSDDEAAALAQRLTPKQQERLRADRRI